MSQGSGADPDQQNEQSTVNSTYKALFELVDVEWLAEPETLKTLAAQFSQHVSLCSTFNALGDHTQPMQSAKATTIFAMATSLVSCMMSFTKLLSIFTSVSGKRLR